MATRVALLQRCRALFGLAVVTVLLGSCSCETDYGITALMGRPDGSIVALDRPGYRDDSWFASTDTGWKPDPELSALSSSEQWELRDAGALATAVVNEPADGSEACVDGYCARENARGEVHVRRNLGAGDADTTEAAETRVWSDTDLPGYLYDPSDLCKEAPALAAFGWATDSTGEPPTLVMALGTAGIATWNPTSGREFHQVDDNRLEGRWFHIEGQLKIVGVVSLLLVAVGSLLLTTAVLATVELVRRSRRHFSPWVALGIAACIPLAYAAAMIAPPTTSSVLVAVLAIPVLCFFHLGNNPLVTAKKGGRSWVVPWLVSVVGFLGFVGLLSVLAAYHRFGLGGPDAWFGQLYGAGLVFALALSAGWTLWRSEQVRRTLQTQRADTSADHDASAELELAGVGRRDPFRSNPPSGEEIETAESQSD